MNDASTNGLACVRQFGYWSNKIYNHAAIQGIHTYRVDETGVQEMRSTVKQSMHVWPERQYYLGVREAMYSHTERNHWGMGVHRLPEHTPHVHSHRGGGQCSLSTVDTMLDVRVAQVEGESWQLEGRRNTELNSDQSEVIDSITNTWYLLLPICLKPKWVCVFYTPWYIP